MSIKRLAMKKDMVPCPALKVSPGGNGNRFAGAVADSHYDL